MDTGFEKVKDAWWAIRRNRRVKIVVLITLILLAILLGLYVVLQFYGVALFDNKAQTTNQNSTQNVNTANVPAMGQRRIDGVEVAWNDSNYLPVAVMIENLATIRPQAGLSQANLIYEALAEGGITRFLAVYANRDAIVKIGPIRSARHYFVDWAEEYGGIYSYVGGSPQALGVTNSSDYITDLNQFYNAAYYYRSTEIPAPHNLFSSSELYSYALRDLNLANSVGTYESYQYKASSEKTNRSSNVLPLIIDFSTDEYRVEWRYDSASNSYLRWNGGVEHRDVNNDQQLLAQNIVLQKTAISVLEADTGRLDIETIGEGEAMLFQDGLVQAGRWKKTERGKRTNFLTAEGAAMQFNPGVTWIEVISPETVITY